MSKRTRRPAAPEPPPAPEFVEGGIDIVRSSTGEAFYRPHVRPRSWDRLGEEGQYALSAVQKLAANMRELEHHLEVHVVELRHIGASWDLIGWSLGMTGEGARRRYGEGLDDV